MLESISSELKPFLYSSKFMKGIMKVKKTAPSGTALDLSKELSSLRELILDEIEIQSKRSGESSGEHKITLERDQMN